MMKIKLNKEQFYYLNNHLKNGIEDLIDHSPIKDLKQFFYFQISEEKADEIRDWAGEKQQQVGFDINYELNKEGKLLDELIDIFLSTDKPAKPV